MPLSLPVIKLNERNYPRMREKKYPTKTVLYHYEVRKKCGKQDRKIRFTKKIAYIQNCHDTVN